MATEVIVVGNSLDGSLNVNTNLWAERFQASVSETVTHLGFLSGATSEVKWAVYNNSGTRLYNGTQTTTAGKVFVELSSPLSVTAGDYYWICFLGQDTGATRCDPGSSTELFSHGSQTYSTYTYPASYDWSTGSSWDTLSLSAALLYFEDKPVLVHDGDSLSNGVDNDYVDQIWQTRSGEFDTTILGRGGYTSSQVDSDWSSRAGAVTLSEVYRNTYVLLVGTNDINNAVSASTTRGYIQSIVGKANTYGYDDVIVCTVPKAEIFDATEETTRQTLNGYIAADAATYGYTVCDIAALSELSDSSDTDIFEDGTHFSPYGAAIVACEVTRTMGVKSMLLGCFREGTPSNYFADTQLIAGWQAHHSGRVTDIGVISAGSANVKPHVYDGSSSAAVDLLAAEDDSTAVAAGDNVIPLTPFDVTEDSWYWPGAVGSATGALTYFGSLSTLFQWGDRSETFSSFSASDPIGAGISYSTSAQINYFLLGYFAPVIESCSVSEVEDAQTGVVVGGRSFGNSGYSAYLGDADTWAGCTTTQAQTVTAGSNYALTLTIDSGTLSAGTVYFYVFNESGLINATGYSVTLTAAGNAFTAAGSFPAPTGAADFTQVNPVAVAGGFPAPTGAADFTQRNTVVAAGTFPAPGLAGDFSQANPVVVAGAFPAPNLAADFSQANPAAVAGALPAPSGAANFSQANAVAVAGSFAAPVVAATFAQENAFTAVGSFPAPVGSAVFVPINPMVAAGSFPAPTGEAEFSQVDAFTITGTFTAPVAVATFEQAVAAAMAGQFPAPVGSGVFVTTAENPLTAVGVFPVPTGATDFAQVNQVSVSGSFPVPVGAMTAEALGVTFPVTCTLTILPYGGTVRIIT